MYVNSSSNSGGWATITTTNSTGTDWFYTYPDKMDWQEQHSIPSVWIDPEVMTGGWKQKEWDEMRKERMKLEAESKKYNKKENNKMGVFEVIIVDKKECEILHKQHVVAKDKETAMLELDLTPDIRKKVKKNLIEFIFNELGSFTRVDRKIVVREIEDGNDED